MKGVADQCKSILYFSNDDFKSTSLTIDIWGVGGGGEGPKPPFFQLLSGIFRPVKLALDIKLRLRHRFVQNMSSLWLTEASHRILGVRKSTKRSLEETIVKCLKKMSSYHVSYPNCTHSISDTRLRRRPCPSGKQFSFV